MTDLIPGTYILNGSGDLAMEGKFRPFINKQVEVIKKCKPGLYQIRTETGELFSVPKRNLDTEDEIQYRLGRPPVDLSSWTVEAVQDLTTQHGLDVESTLVEVIDKSIGGLYGALIGDACGCPYEFQSASQLPAFELIDMIPPPNFKRTWEKVPVGTYTDDGAQMLCLLETLTTGPRSTLITRLRAKLIAWLGAGYMSVDNITFDVGGQTRSALQFCKDAEEVATKLSGNEKSSNGSLMRCLPVALVATSIEEAIQLAATQSLATHPNLRCQISCSIYAGIAYEMLQGKDADDVIDNVIKLITTIRPEAKEEIEFITKSEYIEPTGTGYVVDCLWSALHALRVGKTYKDVIKHAIALGNDTDTTACVAGGLAGIKFGFSNLPSDWVDLLRNKERIQRVCGV